MYFKIKECELYGILRPYLILSGWVEKSVSRIEIISNKQVVYEKKFNETKSKTHIFQIREALKNCSVIADCRLIAYIDGEEHLLNEFRTTPITRLIQKLKPNKNKRFKQSLFGNNKEVYKSTLKISDKKSYQYWIDHYETFNSVDNYQYNPLISIIMPVYNVSKKYLSLCIDSILNQTYQNFEICIADDCSTNKDTIETLKEYMQKDERIKVIFREKNGHISEATNSALTLAKGEFIGMMDNDDLLMPQALNEIIRVLNYNHSLDFIYTDEDKVDLEDQRSDPQFKPDFTMDKLLGGNYICHFNVIRKSIMDKVGGFKKGFEGAQDFDLFLRITEITDKFYHIPKVLYHWRMIPGSTALSSDSKNYAGEAGKRALEEYFERKGRNVQVDIVVHTHYYIEYILKEDPRVEIIMKVTNTDNFLRKIDKIKDNVIYKNFEFSFIVESEEMLQKVNAMKIKSFRVFKNNKNYVATLNDILSTTVNEYILFLNEDVYLETFDALDQFVGYSSMPEYGALGCKIMNTQHLIRETGYYVLDKHTIPLYYGAFYEEYGIYGTLLVPNAFRLLEDKCFMINLSKIKEMKYFDDNLNEEDAYMDLFMRLNQAGYRNVHLPRIDAVMEMKEISIYKLSDALLKKWESLKYDLVQDPFYNKNVSKRISYRFEK